jgi:hypothetical protein
MSLRHHQIECAIIAFDIDQDEQVIGRISKPTQLAMPVTKTENDSHEDSIIWKVGYGSVKLGTIILSIPDPLPFIDESVGIGLVAGGAAMMYSQQR